MRFRTSVPREMTAGQGNIDTGGTPQRQDGPVQREAAFRRALSHSRRVRLLKLALPLSALLITGSFAAYSYISVPGSVSFDISESAYADGKLVMANPKLDGYTKESRPYSMTATRALQHVDKSAIVELEGIDARLPVSDEIFALIGADRGVYDREKNTLDVPSLITVKTTDGMTATLQSAYLEIDKGNLRTDKPVDIRMDGARIAADSMSVLENGKVLIFEKRVKMELRPDRLKKRSAADNESSKDNAQN
jgi:lipopolysaccharide export system protein LptC